MTPSMQGDMGSCKTTCILPSTGSNQDYSLNGDSTFSFNFLDECTHFVDLNLF